MPTDLPVGAVLPALVDALDRQGAAVLVAPPGAGKTTLVPPALAGAPFAAGGRILVMLPRRLAARAAAERMAELAGPRSGADFGYRTRLESRPGRRVECLTPGLFVTRLLADPALEGVSALVFDEIHERSLDGDLALALAIEARALNPALRLLAMSATIDGARFARLLGDAPVIACEGAAHPLVIHHLGRPSGPLEAAMASAIAAVIATHPGHCLAFLPGAAEIARTAERIGTLPDTRVLPLHGSLEPAAQRAALAPTAARKIILASAIAETSLTIDGVGIVVDSGLARRPRRDGPAGLVRLATERVSQAAATQRAGRAARQGPGHAYRLWDEAETRGLPPFDPPEMLEADLSGLMLRLAAWGVTDPCVLPWLDPPPEASVARARAQLAALGAIDAAGRLTSAGRAMSALPVSPISARLLVEGGRRGQADVAAALAVLLEEPASGGRASDLESRLRALERAPRFVALARRWARMAAGQAGKAGLALAPPLSPAALLADAMPDRVARRRPGGSRQPGDGQAYLMASGRAARLEAGDPLARAEWLVVADAGGGGADARIRLAAALEPFEIDAHLEGRATRDARTAPDPATGRLVRLSETRLGAILVSRAREAAPPELVAAAHLERLSAHGLGLLPWPSDQAMLRQRIAFASATGLAGLPDVTDAGLLARADLWLTHRLACAPLLDAVDLSGALETLLPHAAARALDCHAPARFESPAGTSLPIAYSADAPPSVEVRVQALFGLARHPAIAGGRVPLLLILTSPAGRPVATTSDLPGFWAAGWRDVQREMKGRYPKHPWPDDPVAAMPTLRAKAAAGPRRPR